MGMAFTNRTSARDGASSLGRLHGVLSQCGATVDHELRAGHVPGFVGCEVKDAIGHIQRLAEMDGQQGVARRHGTIHPSERSEEHTSELQSLMRISYAVFCLKKKKKKDQK